MTDVEVDQSGKIEKTAKDTALAFSDDIAYSILIPAAVKRAALSKLRQQRYPDRMIYLRMFSAGLFLLLRDHLAQIGQITIDPEYPGWEAEIKGMLLRHVRGIYPDWWKEKIVFERIGKKSRGMRRRYRYIGGGATWEKDQPKGVLSTPMKHKRSGGHFFPCRRTEAANVAMATERPYCALLPS